MLRQRSIFLILALGLLISFIELLRSDAIVNPLGRLDALEQATLRALLADVVFNAQQLSLSVEHFSSDAGANITDSSDNATDRSIMSSKQYTQNLAHGLSNFETLPYVLEPCSDCAIGRITHAEITCFQRIQKYMRDHKIMTVTNASIIVANEFPEHCGSCHPQACAPANRTKYYKLDTIAPRTLYSHSHYLRSIPSVHRVPEHAWTNLSQYLFETTEKRLYLFEYNPSIVRLPESQRPIDAQDAVYIASYRVTNLAQCLGEYSWQVFLQGETQPKETKLIGVALLRKDLSIVREGVFSLVGVFPYYQDYRLFELNGQLYMTSYTFIVPIWVNPPSPAPPQQAQYKDKRTRVLVPSFPDFSDLTFNLTVRGYYSCVRGLRPNDKNLVYFWDDTVQKAIVEHHPGGTKEVMDLDGSCDGDAKDTNQTVPIQLIDPQNNMRLSKSFVSEDSLHFKYHRVTPPSTGDRGSACCVSLHDPIKNRDLWVGISHSKFKFMGADKRDSLDGNVASNTFFSKFYAMEKQAPYSIVAVTGNFCFGQHSANETQQNVHAGKKATPFRVGRLLDCPAIHFVTGMVEKVDDPSRVIISYGVNDCSSRMVEVSKDDIYKMLFLTSSQ